MKILNQYAKYLVISFIAAIITACSGGICPPSSSPFNSYTFPNGSKLTGTGIIQTSQGSSPSATFTLNGGTNLPFAIQLSAIPSSSPQNTQLQSVSNNSLSGSFTPEVLEVTANVSESTSNLSVEVPQNLSPGTYYLNLYANPIAGTNFPANTYLGYIKVVVTANTVTNTYAYVAAKLNLVGGPINPPESTTIYRYAVDKITGALTYDNYSITIPYAIGNNLIVSGNNLYISANDSGVTGGVLVYSINSSTGDLNFAESTGEVPYSTNTTYPGAMAIYGTQSLYVMGNTSDQIDLYGISNNPILNFVESYYSVNSNLNDTYSIAVNNSTGYLYTFGSSEINVFQLNKDGSLGAKNTVSIPNGGIAGTATVNNNNLYFVRKAPNFFFYTLGAGGVINNPSTPESIALPSSVQSVSFWEPNALAFSSTSAYVADIQNKVIWKYSINQSGNIVPDNESYPMPSSDGLSPFWISIYPAQ